MDRITFNHLVRTANTKKRNSNIEFIGKIEILSNLSKQEQLKICDSLEKKILVKDDIIINQGEKGNTFYIVLQGNAEAWKLIEGNSKL